MMFPVNNILENKLIPNPSQQTYIAVSIYLMQNTIIFMLIMSKIIWDLIVKVLFLVNSV